MDDISYEFFYWDPSCVSLIIKQAHLIKKLYKSKNRELSVDSPIFNYTIYPRCIDDSNLGFFNENSNISTTACTGGRDSWFYILNHELPKKILDIANLSHRTKTQYMLKKYVIGQ